MAVSLLCLYYKPQTQTQPLLTLFTMTEFVADSLRPVDVAKVNWTNDTRRMDDTVVVDDQDQDQDPSWIHKDNATVAEGLRIWRRHIDDVIGYEYPVPQAQDDQEDEDEDDEDEILRAVRKEWDEEDAREEANPWTEMVHDDELYYVNSDRTLWYKSSDMSPYPRKYYPGMEEKVDYEDSPKVFTYVGGRG